MGGGRLRGDYRSCPRPQLLRQLRLLRRLGSAGAELDIHDAYAGVLLGWQEHRSHATLSFGPRLARERENTDPDYPLHPAQTHSLDMHVELVAAQALTRRFSLELSAGTATARSEHGRPAPDLEEGDWALGLRWSPSLIVAAGFEYTSDPQAERPPCGQFMGQPVCETYTGCATTMAR